MKWGITPEMSAQNAQFSPKQAFPRRVAIIGGGLAGLSAAHRLTELAKERGQVVEVTLIEASGRLGGIVGTERIGDYLVDVGADSFITNKPGAIGLCRRLGLEDRLVKTDERYRGAMVLFDGRPVPIPDGFQLLSPTAIWPVITSPLFSIWGKIRLLMEWFVPVRSPQSRVPARSTAAETDVIQDESLAAFVRRRFGREALNRLIQPLVGGIYTSDPEKLSLAATMPRFLEMERDSGSLIRAALRAKSQLGREKAERENTIPIEKASSGARYGLFAGLKGGMEDLVNALTSHVQSTCKVRLKCAVQSVEAIDSPTADNSAPVSYSLKFSDGTREEFSAVIVATSASRIAQLLKNLNPQLSRELSDIEFASSALVISGHRLADIRDPLHSFGLVIPVVERRRILAVSYSSRKFPDRAPAGRVLLRTFVGGALQPELFNLNDEKMMAVVKEELAEIFGVRGEPDFMRVYRYPRAMPQYHVGHLDRVARIEALTQQHPALALAGIAFHGVGIPDAISSGEKAAEAVF